MILPSCAMDGLADLSQANLGALHHLGNILSP